MASITDKAFKELIKKFELTPSFVFNQTVNDLLGVGKWTRTDVQNTLNKFQTYKLMTFSAETYYNDSDIGTKNEGTLWIKIYRTDVQEEQEELLTSEEAVVEDTKVLSDVVSSKPESNKPERFFKRNIYYTYEYSGNISDIPQWISEKYSITPSGKHADEFKLIIGTDDWLLVREGDTLVYDVDRDRITVYEKPKEVYRLYISESEILNNR